jgi:hypothetical protein
MKVAVVYAAETLSVDEDHPRRQVSPLPAPRIYRQSVGALTSRSPSLSRPPLSHSPVPDSARARRGE